MKTKAIAGASHPDTLRYMNSLAVFYKSQGKSDCGRGTFGGMLVKGKNVVKTDPYILLTAMHTLGGLDDDTGEYDIAEQFYKDCLSLSSKVLGEDHQDTLLSLYNLAMFYFKQGTITMPNHYCMNTYQRKRKH